MLFGALVGTLSQTLIPLVFQAKTTKAVWDILAKTYALQSRDHIKQLKDQFNRTVKGNRSISEFMQDVKACADQLATIGKTIDHKDLIDKMLIGLDESYTSVIEAVNRSDTTISFEELHEKLINKELTIQQSRHDSSLHATAFAQHLVMETGHHGKSYGRGYHLGNTAAGILPSPVNKQPRPFLGKCQWSCTRLCHLPVPRVHQEVSQCYPSKPTSIHS